MGRLDVDGMLSEIPSTKLQEWEAYCSIEPFQPFMPHGLRLVPKDEMQIGETPLKKEASSTDVFSELKRQLNPQRKHGHHRK
jgi:hypothetical protein